MEQTTTCIHIIVFDTEAKGSKKCTHHFIDHAKIEKLSSARSGNKHGTHRGGVFS